MRSKWEGVPINLVPADQRECEITRREDEAEKKSGKKGKTVHEEGNADSIVERSSVDVIAKMNAPSIFSRGLHSGMMSKSGAQRVNKKRVPDSPMGTQMVAKQDRDRPMPILQSKEDESLRKELNAARKQIELDEQDKDALRETIEKQQKRIETLEKEPKLTEEMAADLFALKKRRESDAKRVANWEKRHPRLK
jgi:hypothetical protein